MKVRNDFVTNSSSSSYIISYQKIPEIDAETLAKYPMLSCFNELVETILSAAGEYNDTTAGEKVYNKAELDKHFIKEWGWRKNQPLEEIFEDEDYLKSMYDKCIEALDRGCAILFKDVDYSDNTVAHMIRMLGESNIGIEIIDDGN